MFKTVIVNTLQRINDKEFPSKTAGTTTDLLNYLLKLLLYFYFNE